MTSGLGFRIPSSQLPSPQGCPWPPHTRLATAFLPMSPGHLHSHGGQAGEQVRAGHNTRAISYLSPLFLKIRSQVNTQKEKAEYKCVHKSPACNSRTAGTSKQWRNCKPRRPTKGTHLNRGRADQESWCLLLELGSRRSGPRC